MAQYATATPDVPLTVSARTGEPVLVALGEHEWELPLPPERWADLATFVLYTSRRRVTSSAKRISAGAGAMAFARPAAAAGRPGQRPPSQPRGGLPPRRRSRRG
jgi:hypothetical protein